MTQSKPNFKQAMHQIAEAARAKQTEMQQQATATQEPPHRQNVMITRKPDSQEIGEKIIQWTWSDDIFDIDAHYYRVNVGDVKAGTYSVFVAWEANETPALTAIDARKLGLTLLSADEWSRNWQHHMGEFLLIPAEEPTPPLQVVSDDDDEVPGEDVVDDVETQVAPSKKAAPRKRATPRKKTND